MEELLKDWVKDWCRNDFLVENPDYDPDDEESEEYIEELPAGVQLFLAKAQEEQGISNITSQRLGDYSVTFNNDYLISLANQYLRRYKRVKFV